MPSQTERGPFAALLRGGFGIEVRRWRRQNLRRALLRISLQLKRSLHHANARQQPNDHSDWEDQTTSFSSCDRDDCAQARQQRQSQKEQRGDAALEFVNQKTQRNVEYAVDDHQLAQEEPQADLQSANDVKEDRVSF